MKTSATLHRFLLPLLAMLGSTWTTSPAQTNCVTPVSGLVSWWRAEGNALDELGGNHGTLASNTVYGSGRSGQGFVLDGNGDHVALGNPASLQLQNLTIETWIKRSSNSRISYGTDGGGFLLSYGSGGYVFYLGGNAHLYFAKVGDPAQSSAGTITDTNFHHVAVTKSGTTVTFYIDGVANTVASSGSTFVFTTPVAIGAQGNNADNSFLGTIDEMAVYNRALTTNEIQSIYAAGSAGKCSTPAAPYILTQPAPQTVTAGSNVTFSVLAGGTPPLSYQWSFNGTNLSGATTSALVLNNVQVSDSGNYAVFVSNSVSTVTSSNALLTVNPLVCVAPATGLVSWWRAEGSASDELGGNAGTLVGNTAYGAGRSGQGFVFDGTADFVSLGNPTNLQLQNFTIETWIKRASATAISHGTDGGGFLLSYGAGGYVLYLGGNARLYFAKSGDAAVSSTGTITDTNFHHVAVTKGGSTVTFYIDGVANTVASVGSTFTFATSVVIGAQGTGGDNSFLGTIDEMAVYGRALSTNEIQGIYAAGSAGKCSAAATPTITSQPTNQTVTAGGNAAFSVVASGTPPVSYQWSFNGTNLNGATATALILTNVQPADAGNYSVVVSNASGTATSSNAVLTVNAPPPCSAPPAGLVSWWTGNGSSSDSVGTNHASLQNGAGITSGFVGQAISFDGADDFAVIPASSSLNVGAGGGLTIEGWISPADVSSAHALWEWNDGVGDHGVHVWFSIPNYGGVRSIFANLQDTANNDHFFASAPGIMTAGSFQHIALTYDKASGVARIYHNGTVVANQNLGVFTPQTFEKLYLGARPAGAPPIGSYFNGVMDEVSLYNRALTAAEVQAIYGVGSAGKCGSPVAPYIFAQPTNQAVTVGGAAAFTVFAGGSQPLSYQWSFNGTNLSGATSSALMLTNVQLGDAGYYAVVVSNTVDIITSSNALLVVNPAPLCIPAPTYLAGWWKGEGNGADTAGGNVGVLSGGLSFGTGTVGQAFVFNGTDASVVISNQPNLNVGSGSGLTIEAWIKPAGTSPMPLVEWNSGAGSNPYGVHLWTSVGGAGRLFANVVDSAGNHLSIQSATGLLSTSAFQHVALNYEKATGIAKLYLNGQIVAQANLGTFTPRTHYNCYLGFRPAGGVARYTGSMDEISIYARALSDAEIQAIFSAGSAGKCATPVAPYIVTQPTNQSVVAGANATVRVIAGGTPPLSYQWNFNGTNIAGATDAVLTLNAVQVGQAGNYSVVVTNVAGTATSSNAVLTVNLPPAAVRVLSTNATSSSTVVVPVVVVANGNENAVGFSLNFDPTVLSFSGVTLGTGTSGASLISNTNQIGSGKLGLAVAMPVGIALNAGTQEVVRVAFVVAIVTNNMVTPLGFGDQPVVRQLVDAPGNPLAATFTGASVSVPAADFEADVSPRPEGNRVLTVTDWVLVGRYVARLDNPTNANEFQRADCAPRNHLGNGQLAASDWVQAGRYVAGLDPLTPVGGPLGEALPRSSPAKSSPAKKDAGTRQLKVTNALSIRGQPGRLALVLESEGDENALGVSLTFDPAAINFTNFSLGSGAAGAALHVNTNLLGAGKLGVLLALTNGGSFTAGSREVLTLDFLASTANTGNFPVSFADQPVPREVADPGAGALPVSYVPGVVAIKPFPSLTIAPAGTNVLVSWPLWAANFVLQECAGDWSPAPNWTNVAAAPATNSEASFVTLPIASEPKFYRLRGQ